MENLVKFGKCGSWDIDAGRQTDRHAISIIILRSPVSAITLWTVTWQANKWFWAVAQLTVNYGFIMNVTFPPVPHELGSILALPPVYIFTFYSPKTGRYNKWKKFYQNSAHTFVRLLHPQFLYLLNFCPNFLPLRQSCLASDGESQFEHQCAGHMNSR